MKELTRKKLITEIPDTLKPLHFAYIEDEEELSLSLSAKFRKVGVEIDCFINGEEFLKSDIEKYSFILTDKNLPNINGVEIIIKVRDLNLGTPTAIISGYLDEDILFDLARLNVAALFSKPFETNELINLCVTKALLHKLHAIKTGFFKNLMDPQPSLEQIKAQHQELSLKLQVITDYLTANERSLV